MVIVLKLGGSVITQKGTPETVDSASLAACARDIGEYEGDLLLVHGGGSFGHYHAERHDVTVTNGTDDARVVTVIHESMRTLNRHVLTALHDHDVAAVGVEPLSMAHRDATGALVIPARQLRTILDLGCVPVLFGDVIPNAGSGFTIVSGDELVVEFAAELGASCAGLCSDVPGVLDAQGSVIDQVKSLSDVDALGESTDVDVTGGMVGKVNELLRLPMPATIFGLDDLQGFLAGESVGTRVEGSVEWNHEA